MEVASLLNAPERSALVYELDVDEQSIEALRIEH
jgi:hypothetical protein